MLIGQGAKKIAGKKWHRWTITFTSLLTYWDTWQLLTAALPCPRIYKTIHIPCPAIYRLSSCTYYCLMCNTQMVPVTSGSYECYSLLETMSNHNKMWF